MLYDVALPEMAVGTLTYSSPVEIPEGARVIVSVRKNLHVGFILGPSKESPAPKIKIKPVEAIIDSECVIDSDLWELALYASRVCFCSPGAALSVVLPKALITGENLTAPPEIFKQEKNFQEENFFNPFDLERVNFYLNQLESNERTLILFPAFELAKKFFEELPEKFKSDSILWPVKNLWPSWKLIHEKKFRVVIGASGGVFAPLSPEKIIIEDEINSSYIIPPVLNLSARSLAGHRAMFLGAKFITGGRLPSLKTFLRAKPEQKFLPERKNIILSDIFYFKTKQESSQGIEGKIPLTLSLIKNTYRELAKDHNVLWILNRKGESSEVFCENCGKPVKCSKCGSSMRSEGGGNFLRCRICGARKNLPEKCDACGSKFFKGRRPGLEALEKIVSRYFKEVQLYNGNFLKTKTRGLILSTQKGLELCGKINLSLIAWLDLDLELWRPEYDTRFKVFKLLWDSYWRGREKNSERKILIQARSSGMKLAKFLVQGWQNFFENELEARREFLMPPYGYMLEVECRDAELREKIIEKFFDTGIFVMDPGEINLPLYINANSLQPVQKILAENFSRELFKKNLLKITVRNE